MFNNMIKNALAIVPVALAAQAFACYTISGETLDFFSMHEGSFHLMPGEEVILDIYYTAMRDGIYTTLSLDSFSENLDVQTYSECVGKYCKTTWTVQAGDQPERTGFTIRTPSGEVKRIPVHVVEEVDEEMDSIEEIVEETTEDSSDRRLQAEVELPSLGNCSNDDKDMLRFVAREDIPVEDQPWNLIFRKCYKLEAGADGADTEFEVAWAEGYQTSLQAKFLRAAGADIADVVCWKAGMEKGAAFAPGC